MAEYTYKDIIIDPTSEEAKNAVGKECYMECSPQLVLFYANNGLGTHCLSEILENSVCPFFSEEKGEGCSCIIVKKEEPKPKHVPFESKEEFIDAFHYHDNTKYSETDDILLNYGMWLKLNELYVLVTCISDEYIKTFESCYFWNELLENFEFLDGSPCGKESKDE